MITWEIWNVRNRLIHGNRKQPLGSEQEWIKDYLEQYQACRVTANIPRPRRDVGWLPPPNGFVRVDVDTAHNRQNGKFGFGAVIRDSEGGAVAAKSIISDNIACIYMAEMNAV